MYIDIRRLTPDLVDDYVCFFDVTPHDKGIKEQKCYCVCWAAVDSANQDFSSAAKRREAAIRYVESGAIQGYLAYLDGKVVAWCNANTRSSCLKCVSWRYFMDYVPLTKEDEKLRIKSIFCFVVAPQMKRQGIATMMVERVCLDAASENFDFVEAYPYLESGYQSSPFGGYSKMYERCGFQKVISSGKGLVMRKKLSKLTAKE